MKMKIIDYKRLFHDPAKNRPLKAVFTVQTDDGMIIRDAEYAKAQQRVKYMPSHL